MRRASQPYLFFFVLLLCFGLRPVQAQVLPLDQKNTITSNWMVQRDGETQLVPYIAGVHDSYNALHQWLPVSQAQPFVIAFAAPQDLCLFLNNRLIFKADFAANYTLNLSDHTKKVDPVQGKYLLTVWHPAQQPNIRSFHNAPLNPTMSQSPNQRPFSIQVRDYVNQNAFILFMLIIGLLYGVLRVNYPADFQQMFSFNRFFSSTQREELYATKPVSSISNMLFLLAFSLSLALLITAIHTNLQHVKLFNRLFPVSEADITTKIVFYTIMVFCVVLFKYIFLKVMSFIFGLEQVVELQYMEFMRSLLFLGLFLPLVMLLYLGLNMVLPDAIVLISSLAVSFVLVITILRVFAAVNKKASVLNLHLFSYLCATEVIPLAIILKLIVFNY